MKLAILTLRLLDNYGGLLQAFALQRVLENMGHSVQVLDSPKAFSVPRGKKTVTYAGRLAKKLLGQQVELFREKRLTEEYPIVNQNTNRFINEYINRLEVEDFHKLSADDFEGIVVGSDQIWRPKYCWGGKIERGFLDFAVNWDIKRVAFAASFGTNKWEYSKRQTERCAELLQKFDAISVRESSGTELCDVYLHRSDAVQLLDPTMLLDADIYKKIADRYPAEPKSEKLMVYFLDEQASKNELVEKVSSLIGQSPFRSGVKHRAANKPIEERIHPSVEEWLNDFVSSEFVVTDSFHGCIFSVLFQKPFLVYGNSSRGSERFASLLKMLELEDRLVSENTTQKQIKEIVSSTIDFNKANSVLNEKRKEAMMYLKKHLEINE